MFSRFDYGKLVNGQIEYPPLEFHENDIIIVGFTEDFILQHGYKKIITSDIPDETKSYQPVYTETDTNIIQSWVAE